MTEQTTPAPAENSDDTDHLADIRSLPAWEEPESYRGSLGRTMFDTPGAKDNTITVLLPTDSVQQVPAQSLVRINSHPDGRGYLGIVVAGPFAEPDGLRADAPAIITTAVRGATFMPRYHGRVQVEIIGEQLPSGTLVPPRFRPLPNSPVFVLDSAEKASILKVEGTMLLGVAVGDESIDVKIAGDRKSVLPRHTGILGTTGGGKSTTVSRLIGEAARDKYAVILLDTEGEYTQINEATVDPTMLAALAARGQQAQGVSNTRIYTLVGKDTSNPGHPDVAPFTLQFSAMSPFVVEELLDLNDAQKQRFEKAYDTTKLVLQDLGIFPQRNNAEDMKASIELDEFDTGYPKMRLANLYDVVALIHAKVGKEDPDDVYLRSSEFRGDGKQKVLSRIDVAANATSNVLSWRALLGKVSRLMRLNVFDHPEAKPLDYDQLLQPGKVSIFDLSDTDSPLLNNLVIADLLRGTQRRQDERYQASQTPGGTPLTKALIIIEEAHEFLSEERLAAMPHLFQQVARIAKRGRKRWLSLVFVTQLPQHLPRQVLGLVNNFVLHKINDATTISRLKSSIAGIDDALWQRLPGLAPGQAIVTFTSMTRPLLVAVDATPTKLRMID
jgi:DNA helicase HerA-like ATPase